MFVERGDVVRALFLPCGQCVGCRLERSRQWAVRIMHEAAMHDVSSFVTLTYDDAHLDARGSLCYRDYQLFMKRMRKKFGSVRFFVAGEYGALNWRPHFHACLFGFWLSDFKYWRKSDSGFNLYRSATVEMLWPYGSAEIGALTFESAAYCARYCMDKVNGELAADHYRRVDADTGEIYHLVPEFCRMSLRPGIGADWFSRFGRRVMDHDSVISNGHPAKPPRYYDVLHKRLDAVSMEQVKYQREVRGRLSAADNTDERLAVRLQVAKARLGFKKRSV